MSQSHDVRVEAEQYLREIIEPIARISAEAVSSALSELIVTYASKHTKHLAELRTTLESEVQSVGKIQSTSVEKLDFMFHSLQESVDRNFLDLQAEIGQHVLDLIVQSEQKVSTHLKRELDATQHGISLKIEKFESYVSQYHKTAWITFSLVSLAEIFGLVYLAVR